MLRLAIHWGRPLEEIEAMPLRQLREFERAFAIDPLLDTRFWDRRLGLILAAMSKGKMEATALIDEHEPELSDEQLAERAQADMSEWVGAQRHWLEQR